MTLLPTLYWIILILSCLGAFGPASWPNIRRVGYAGWICLFVIIGLRVFRMPL